MKRLVVELLVNGVRILNWKRTFLEMCKSTVLYLPLYNLKAINRMEKRKTSSSAKVQEEDDVKKLDFDVLQGMVSLCIDGHVLL